jgi:glycosyltransferase involved in cell wall biosynthesis
LHQHTCDPNHDVKVLHLTTYDNFGGAARAAYRQHLALLQSGVDSQMLVRYKHSHDAAVKLFTGDRSWPARINRTLRRGWIAYQEKQSRGLTQRIISGLTDPRADLLRGITAEMAEADLINIHKTEHFVDLPSFMEDIPSTKPVVITLHDLSPITGGCDYSEECRRFESACGRCPILNSNSPNDYSSKIFRLRQKAYTTRLNGGMAFVCNSFWTGKNARRSGLTRGHKVEVVHPGVDHRVYSTYKRQEARLALGINLDEHVVCFAAHNLSSRHKGADLLHEALSILKTLKPVRLLTMGAGFFKAPEKYRHSHYGMIESDLLQVLLYRAADVFVIPSLEEAFGQTALEAAACGTVVAGFKVGGLVDIVENGVNGRLVERGNTGALSSAILELLEDHEMRVRWQAAAEAWMRERFSFEKNARAYVAVYESMLKPEKPNDSRKT